MKLKGKVIVITGAGSGIGRALALEALRRGASVAAVDLRPDGLQSLTSEATAQRSLSTHTADVTDKTAVQALPDAVRTHHGAIDGVINCAGIIQPFVTFNELADDDIDRVFKVNLTGTLNIVRAFLPVLLARPSGHLGLVSSMGGFLPFPKQAVYSSSKAAVKVLGEALYAETRDTTVGVSVIMPGAVDTRISENSGVEIAVPEGVEPNALPASDAARIILDGIEADRLHILVGKDARQLWLLTRLMPTRAIGIVQKQMKKLGL